MIPKYAVGAEVAVSGNWCRGKRRWFAGVVVAVTPKGFMDVQIHGAWNYKKRFNSAGKEHGGNRFLSDMDDVIRRAIAEKKPVIDAGWNDLGHLQGISLEIEAQYPRRVAGDPLPGANAEASA